MKHRVVAYLAVVVSVLFALTSLPSLARADAFNVLNLTIKTSVVIGDWGHQRSIEWIYQVTNDADTQNDYWFVYTEAQYKAGCFVTFGQNPQVAEALWGPPHLSGNPTEVAVKPGTYFQLLPESMSIGGAGGSLSFSLGGVSHAWSGTESTAQNEYWAYDRYAQGMVFTVFAGSSWWGSIGSAIVFRVTQHAHIGIYVQVSYQSDDCWNWPYLWYTDSAASGWKYFDS